MSRVIKNLSIVIVLFIIGCSTPGYMVKIEATEVDQVEPSLLNELEGIPKNSGFSVIWERREHTLLRNEFSSSYSKKMSDKSHDFISIDIYYSGMEQPKKRIKIKIENKLRGQEPPVKTQIDGLGDIFYEELSKSVGKDKVLIERKPTSIPLFY